MYLDDKPRWFVLENNTFMKEFEDLADASQKETVGTPQSKQRNSQSKSFKKKILNK